MQAYILRRLLALVPTLIFTSIIVFASMRLIPGDVIDLMLAQNDIATGQDRAQIESALGWLESLKPAPWLCGDRMCLADITCAVAFTFLREKQQIPLSSGDFPRIEQHCDRCEKLPIFKASAYSASEAARSGWKLGDS